MSRVHSDLALTHLSNTYDKLADTPAEAPNDSPPESTNPAQSKDFDVTAPDTSVAADKAAAFIKVNRQRLHLHARTKQSFEFSPELNTLSKGMRESIEKLRKSGAISSDIEDPSGLFASSVVKKRRKKMNKHKYKKRRKRDRGYSV